MSYPGTEDILAIFTLGQTFTGLFEGEDQAEAQLEAEASMEVPSSTEPPRLPDASFKQSLTPTESQSKSKITFFLETLNQSSQTQSAAAVYYPINKILKLTCGCEGFYWVVKVFLCRNTSWWQESVFVIQRGKQTVIQS